MESVTSSTVLLFYGDCERDRFFRHDRYVRRLLRPGYKLLKGDQSVSGFYVWFQSLVKALRQAGQEVVIDDYDRARRNPEFPVGLVGYPSILTGWDLPNPAILGPGMYDHPALHAGLMADPRFRAYIVSCQWMDDMFRPSYGSTLVRWYAGIDTHLWPDTRGERKTIDVLVYDKIRWNREQYEPSLLNPILAELQRRGLSYRVVRYGHHQHRGYRKLLRNAQAMIFLCEHETQGLAYQEAMASNLPILAWDPGYWVDPKRPVDPSISIPATSVPYFSPSCGETFENIAEFHRKFPSFWEQRAAYEPRRFVQQHLSLAGSAELYLRAYRAVGAAPPAGPALVGAGRGAAV